MQKNITCFFSFIVLWQIINYLDIYYVHYPVHYSHYIMYGTREIVDYVSKNKYKYNQIVIDPDFGIESKNITNIPHIYFLVYEKTDPTVIQKAMKDQVSPFGFDKYVFRSVYWPEDRKLKNTLLIASFWQLSPEEIPEEKIVKVVSLYNKMPMFYLVETDK